MKTLILTLLTGLGLMAQSVQVDGQSIYLQNDSEQTIMAAVACTQDQTCVMLVDRDQQTAPGERRFLHGPSSDMQRLDRNGNPIPLPLTGWRIVLAVKPGTIDLTPGEGFRALAMMRAYYRAVTTAVGPPNMKDGGFASIAQRRARFYRFAHARAAAILERLDELEQSPAVQAHRKAEAQKAAEAKKAQEERQKPAGKGPIAKNARGGQPYGFDWIWPRETFCWETGGTIASCNHSGQCEDWIGSGLAPYLAVGWQARTSCPLHIPHAQSNVQFRLLDSSGSIRHSVWGTDVVSPGFWIQNCEGLNYFIPAGPPAHTCSISPVTF